MNEHSPAVTYTLVALSYRGYWTSSGSPSQWGIELDARAVLDWVYRTYGSSEKLKVVLWGQSIGAGVATTAAAQYLHSRSSEEWRRDRPTIHGLILETPFLGVKSMLQTLYPQRWLPYRYLSPFLRSRWDSDAALREISNLRPRVSGANASSVLPRVLILQAGKDELVPAEQAIELEELCRKLGFAKVERKLVHGALHTEVLARSDGRRAVVDVLRSVGQASE